jgi:hypothetical protein
MWPFEPSVLTCASLSGLQETIEIDLHRCVHLGSGQACAVEPRGHACNSVEALDSSAIMRFANRFRCFQGFEPADPSWPDRLQHAGQSGQVQRLQMGAQLLSHNTRTCDCFPRPPGGL